MPLRTRYGYNCQKVNFGKVGEILPQGYMEVVPGDTVSGRVSIDCQSAPVIRQINTRTYMDSYAFYVPYRLLWSRWQSFIAQQGGAPLEEPPGSYVNLPEELRDQADGFGPHWRTGNKELCLHTQGL